MNRLKRVIARISIVLTVGVLALVGVPTANASSASAATFSNWTCTWQGASYRYFCKSLVDYNWWEDNVLGKPDKIWTYKQSYYDVSGSRNPGQGY